MIKLLLVWKMKTTTTTMISIQLKFFIFFKFKVRYSKTCLFLRNVTSSVIMFCIIVVVVLYLPLTVYGGGNPSPIMSLSLSKLSWLVAIDGSELDLTNCGKLPRDNDVDGPGLNSKSDSGLDAYDKRLEVMGNRKSSDKDSTGFIWFYFYLKHFAIVWCQIFKFFFKGLRILGIKGILFKEKH